MGHRAGCCDDPVSDNSLKTPLFRAMNDFAVSRINDAIQNLAKGLPCSVVSCTGSIVTVKFEIVSGFTLPQVTLPMFGGEYIRYPTQPGDKGVVIPMDADIAAISGLGTGTADLSQPGNLTALVFLPISNTAWSAVDPNAVTIYGPNGVVLRDTQSQTTFVLTPTGLVISGKSNILLQVGSSNVQVNSTGVSINGTLMINGAPYINHAHSGVTPGSGDSGGVV